MSRSHKTVATLSCLYSRFNLTIFRLEYGVNIECYKNTPKKLFFFQKKLTGLWGQLPTLPPFGTATELINLKNYGFKSCDIYDVYIIVHVSSSFRKKYKEDVLLAI